MPFFKIWVTYNWYVLHWFLSTHCVITANQEQLMQKIISKSSKVCFIWHVFPRIKRADMRITWLVDWLDSSNDKMSNVHFLLESVPSPLPSHRHSPDRTFTNAINAKIYLNAKISPSTLFVTNNYQVLLVFLHLIITNEGVIMGKW